MKTILWMLGILVVAATATVVFILFFWKGEPEARLPFSPQAISAHPPQGTELRKELQNLHKVLAKIEPQGQYIVIDTHANYAYLRTRDSILFKATCSTGSGGELLDSTTGRKWTFITPHGAFKIQNKLVQPWWYKPDWAFLEENEEIPKNPADRLDPNVMGEYALGIGGGYFIHGTIYERLLGLNVTHGCVRLGSDDLKWLYDRVRIGTQVYIF